MLWTYFSNCFLNISNTFLDNSNIFGKVYFPRLVVPISRVFTNLITALVQFATLLCFYLWYFFQGSEVRPLWWAFATPLIIVWIAMLSSGLGMLVTAITTRFRDLKQLITFGLQLFMYATPIVYPLSAVPEKYKWVFYINPLSAPIELFRIWFFGSGYVPVDMIAISIVLTLICFFSGLVMFNKYERSFVDVI
jgi:lipopolysaccharide transport system permease protein